MRSEFAPGDVSDRWMYRTLMGTVVPRPIGWLSTVDAEGRPNLAPFSFFGVANVDPPILHVTIGSDGEGETKDTARNIRESGEFVHNLVTRENLDHMHDSSTPLPTDESEFDVFDIETTPSAVVEPPRVAGAPVHFECSLERTLEFPTYEMFFGRIEHVHISESVATEEGKLDINRFEGVGRLTNGWYALLDDRIHRDSVKGEDFPKNS
ncbi:MAG: flavin reductase family protein [Halanaeroarchaeum sp.]